MYPMSSSTFLPPSNSMLCAKSQHLRVTLSLSMAASKSPHVLKRLQERSHPSAMLQPDMAANNRSLQQEG